MSYRSASRAPRYSSSPKTNGYSQQGLVQLGFIRKVYGILSAQLLVTAAACAYAINGGEEATVALMSRRPPS